MTEFSCKVWCDICDIAARNTDFIVFYDVDCIEDVAALMENEKGWQVEGD